MIATFLMLAAAVSATVSAPPSVVIELRAMDQALLDGIAPGDRALWARTLTDDAVYVDENGLILPRDRFLTELVALPGGVSGHITIIDYDVRLDGDTALVRHRDDERETYHGQPLHAEYLMTETWLRRSGAWRLASVHAYVVPTDPPAIPLSPGKLDRYVGTYLLADLTRTIRRDGDHLSMTQGNGEPKPLLAETSEVFFVPGQPRTRLIFEFDGGGHVSRCIDRREGEDLVFARQHG